MQSHLAALLVAITMMAGCHVVQPSYAITGPVVDAQEDGVVFRVLPRTFAVSGRVVDGQGAGVAGVTIMDKTTGTEVMTDSTGSWRIEGLRERATIVAAGRGRAFIPPRSEVTDDMNDIRIDMLHPITGEAAITREQAREWLRSQYVPPEFLDLVDLYYDIAPIYGIRADVALAQAAHETGFFRFGGIVQPWQNNFAGIGATGAASDGLTPLNGADPEQVRFERGTHGAIFSTKEAGVEAQIQHLYAYATTNQLPEGRPLLSPRFPYVPRGSARYVEHLGKQQNPTGVGWATDPTYGFKIIDHYMTPMLMIGEAD